MNTPLILYFTFAAIITFCAAVGAYILAMETELVSEEWAMTCPAIIISLAILQHQLATRVYKKKQQDPPKG